MERDIFNTATADLNRASTCTCLENLSTTGAVIKFLGQQDFKKGGD